MIETTGNSLALPKANFSSSVLFSTAFPMSPSHLCCYYCVLVTSGFFFFSSHHKWENVNALFHFHMLGVWTNAPSAKRILGPHLLSGLVKRGFIWLIWMSVLSSDRSCSLWSSGSSPSIFLAYVSCFLCRSEWPQFIVSYRWRTQFEIRYHSLSGFCWFVCSTCSYIPFSAG